MPAPAVNNDFYSDLGERWFESDEHAIALLRAESRIKTAYVFEVLRKCGLGPGRRVLDVACGAGLVALPLAEAGYRVHGVDLAEGALDAARRRVPPGTDATFAVADAYALDDADETYDAVLLLDMLEHVDRPADVFREAARVTKPGGLVLFHTFNRTPAAWALAIHGMKVVARDTPAHVHVYHLFITPDELRAMARAVGLDVQEMHGSRPVVDGAFWRSVLRRRVDPGFAFTRTRSLAVGYAGYAVKREG